MASPTEPRVTIADPPVMPLSSSGRLLGVEGHAVALTCMMQGDEEGSDRSRPSRFAQRALPAGNSLTGGSPQVPLRLHLQPHALAHQQEVSCFVIRAATHPHTALVARPTDERLYDDGSAAPSLQADFASAFLLQQDLFMNKVSIASR